jgi:formylmethanofuran dehydrogenase subunit E
MSEAQTNEHLVRCAECGKFVDIDDAVVFDGDFFSCRNCADDGSNLPAMGDE